ncbi:MAG: HAMP domain-containing histidine kinase [Opitutales bacterium]|nr:HAMP domain-containing histidine kinase [Opitutales bacterium]
MIYLLLILFSATANGENKEPQHRGHPLWQKYELKTTMPYWSDQAWLQNKEGCIRYISGSALGAFDGTSAEFTDTGSEATLYAIQEAPNGDLYAAIAGDILKIEKNGAIKHLGAFFQDALPETPVSIHLQPGKDDYFFLQSKRELYYYANGSGKKVYGTHGEIEGGFFAQGCFYAVDSINGLIQFDPKNSTFIEINKSKKTVLQKMLKCFSLSDGQGLMITSKGHFVFFDGAKLTEIIPERLPLASETKIKNACIVGDKIALLLKPNSFLVYDFFGNPIKHFRFSEPTENITNLMTDRQDGLWISTEESIYRLQLNSSLTQMNELEGLSGKVNSVLFYEDTLYAGTNQGIFSKKPTDPFHKEEALGSENGCLAQVGDWLIAAKDTQLIARNGSNEIVIETDTQTERLQASRLHPNRFYAISEDRIMAFDHIDEQWCQSLYSELPPSRYRYIVETGEDSIWLGPSFNKGIFVGHFADGSTQIKIHETVSFFDCWVYPILIDNKLFFISKSGLFTWINEQLQREKAMEELFPFSVEKIDRVEPDNRGNWWIQTQQHVGCIQKATGGNIVWFNAGMETALPIEFTSVYRNDDDLIIFGTHTGILSYDLKQTNIPFPLDLEIVSGEAYADDHDEILLPPVSDSAIKLPYSNRNLRFHYRLNNLIRADRNEYRTRLIGQSNKWSSWSNSTSKRYSNLSKGTYTFEVMAKNLTEKESQILRYTVTIAPPWFRSYTAYALYILLFLLMIGIIIQQRMAIIARRSDDLQEIIELKTSELSDRNDQLAHTIEQLNRINTQLQQANLEKDEILGIASHDLKNPLSAVVNLAQIIYKDIDTLSTDEISKHAHEINDCAAVMYEIIRNLLDLNRMDEGRMSVQKTPCNLYELAKEVSQQNFERAARKEIKLHLSKSEESLTCMGDSNLIKQIIDNLIGNAVKYSPYKSNIYVQVYERRNRVVCDVKDEGPGIKTEERHLLFEKFSRLSAQPTGGESSTGLGLAIVKRLTESMNGRVGCISNPGEGATFRISFPKVVTEKDASTT